MMLKDYLQNVMKEMKDTISAKVTIYKTIFECNIVNCETGEIYFSGDINWIVPEFVNDKLVFDSIENHGHTILFKELK